MIYSQLQLSVIKTLFFLLSGISFSAMAVSEGSVFLHGKVLYAPCSIALDSSDQTIDMGETSLTEIFAKGYGPSKNFSIYLINCSVHLVPRQTQYDPEHYQITLDIMPRNGRYFISGDAEGVELAIVDSEGHFTEPEVAPQAGKILSRTKVLNYTVRLVSDGLPLKAGSYQTLIRFRMDYY